MGADVLPAVLMRRGPMHLVSGAGRPNASTSGLVEIRRCDQAEAVVLKSLFESHAIPTLLRSRLAHSVHPFTVGAQGEVVVLVPAREAPRAKRLLIRLVRRPPGA